MCLVNVPHQLTPRSRYPGHGRIYKRRKDVRHTWGDGAKKNVHVSTISCDPELILEKLEERLAVPFIRLVVDVPKAHLQSQNEQGQPYQ